MLVAGGRFLLNILFVLLNWTAARKLGGIWRRVFVWILDTISIAKHNPILRSVVDVGLLNCQRQLNRPWSEKRAPKARYHDSFRRRDSKQSRVQC